MKPIPNIYLCECRNVETSAFSNSTCPIRETIQMKKLILAFALVVSASTAHAREQIQIVGSSTVYPFATIVAEKFGQIGNRTPVIESTGTGGGMKLFCAGIGTEHPDFTNASRAIKSGEKELCAKKIA